MLNLGLCCLFHQENIKFKTYTKSGLIKLSLSEQKNKIMDIINYNIDTLQTALYYCFKNDIKSYRISSDLFPHFDYIMDIISSEQLDFLFKRLSNIKTYNINLSMHPGQHCVPGSINQDTVLNSFRDLTYHYNIMEVLENTVPEINIHLGGTYGDKESAKKRFIDIVSSWNNYCFLTIENDELSYSVEDCIEVAKQLHIPVVFDLHHHNCHKLNPNYIPTKTDYELFLECKQTWLDLGKNYMRMHISSPKDGYSTPSKSRSHSDLIDISDLPEWLIRESENFNIYLDVEAKHKEVAIFNLKEDILNNYPESLL